MPNSIHDNNQYLLSTATNTC